MGRLLGHFQAMDLLAMGYGPLLPALWGTAPQLLGQLQCRPGCHAVPASAWQHKAALLIQLLITPNECSMAAARLT